MKSIVVMTFYQMMHALAMAMTFEEKPNLYFCMEFLNPDEALLERLANTGIFNSVTGITRRGEFRQLVKELRKTKDAEVEEIDKLGSSLFEKYLEPMYQEPFSNADPDDEIFVYNDFQWEYYYITKHFNNIVGVEDGYGSLLQQIGIHVFRGDKENLEPFIERGYYPEPLYKHEKVRKIISSVDFDELDDYYRSKIEICDYKEIVKQNEMRFQQALLSIFDVENMGIKENGVLYLGQPLDRSKYCTALENYLLCRKIISNETEAGYDVYYKPHPAERNDPRVYGNKGVKVLHEDFPVEVLNYQELKFEKLVTFGSTGASLLTCTKGTKKYFDKVEFDREDVRECILDTISEEKLKINIYIKIRRCDPETYINAFSCIFRHARIHTELFFLFENNVELDVCAEYYDKKHLQERIKEYKTIIKGDPESLLWHKELGWMKNWIARYNPGIHYCKVSSFEDMAVFKEMIRKEENYDYFILLDEHNPGFRLTKEVQTALKARIYPAIFFPSYTEVINDRNTIIKLKLKQGYIGSDYNGDMVNKVWHRELIRDFCEGEISKQHFGETIQKYDIHIRKNVGYSLYRSAEDFLSITDGEAYFKQQIDQLKICYRDDREYLIGQLSNVVYDYYDWCAVTEGSAFAITMSEAVDALIDDTALQCDIYRKLANAMHREKTLQETLAISQYSNFYQGIQPIIDMAAESGFLKGVDNIQRIKTKLHLDKKTTKKR